MPLWRRTGGTWHVAWQIEAPEAVLRPPPLDSLVVVAGHADVLRMRPRAVVLVEHGAGQMYNRNRPTRDRPGGTGRGNCVLFLCPNEQVAWANTLAYPSVAAVAVGSPKLDDWRALGAPDPRTVAIAFHWDDRRLPESRSALAYYGPHLASIVEGLETAGRTVIGHGHPRTWHLLEPLYRRIGVEPVANQAEAISRAEVHVFDNSSHGFEAAALGRSVVLLDAPWYRAEAEWGLRFWKWANIGPRCTRPEQVVNGVLAATESGWRPAREAMAAEVFGPLDGAADRGAAAIIELLD
jgi:hypothetical protein